MNLLICSEAEAQFSAYLDGTLSGVAMADVQEHLRHCGDCTEAFAQWRGTLGVLSQLRPLKPPPSLALQLRVAVSREKANTPASWLRRAKLRWENTIAPLAVQASAGLASAVLLLGTVGLLVGTFAAPEPAAARDEPIGMATPPRLLYTTLPDGSNPATAINGSMVIRVFVNAMGRVYDYRVISGTMDSRSREALADEMMWSVFEPARVFNQPVRGSVIVSLAGVSVPG